jgi:transposase
METVVERPAALDVHKEQVTGCVRVPAEGGGREQHVAEFQTTVRGLLALRDWLAAHRVEQVTMEATGVFWKPVWAILEDDFECVLVNARHVKQVPGRKTDVSDAAWLCQLAEAGLLRASFVPPKPIRRLRNLTRYRKTQIQERQREANRLHKALEDTGIKLDCVATDILGASGRAMLAALCEGTTDRKPPEPPDTSLPRPHFPVSQASRDLGTDQPAPARFVHALRGGMYVSDRRLRAEGRIP